MRERIQVFPTTSAFTYGAAEKITGVLSAAQVTHGIVSLVLSGGSTPRAVYELLASPAYRNKIDWQHLHVFWGDERCVAPDSPESNYRMASLALLRHVAVPPQHIHRIHGELPPAEAARAYERDVVTTLGVPKGGIPRCTLILLGLGEDGHTASLFPGSTAVAESLRLVVETFVERLSTWRVSMTYPLLRNAANILFLVSGVSKASIVRAVVRDAQASLPATSFLSSTGNVAWYLDRDAASLLDDTENA
jgi:6-phosphogluconolactonase